MQTRLAVRWIVLAVGLAMFILSLPMDGFQELGEITRNETLILPTGVTVLLFFPLIPAGVCALISPLFLWGKPRWLNRSPWGLWPWLLLSFWVAAVIVPYADPHWNLLGGYYLAAVGAGVIFFALVGRPVAEVAPAHKPGFPVITGALAPSGSAATPIGQAAVDDPDQDPDKEDPDKGLEPE